MKKLISQPLIIAHRGASGYEPENTLRAFMRALELGVSMIELDVWRCKSGELVVIHDETIDRTTNGTGQVKDLSLTSLQHYDAGKGERIPLLSHVFDLVNKQSKQKLLILNIELKGPDTAQPVAQLIRRSIDNNNWSPNNFLISSCEQSIVQEFQGYCPDIPTGVIFDEHQACDLDQLKQIQAQYAIVHFTSVTKEFIAAAHARDIRVCAYTVNTKALAQKLANLHIDGIITDYPDILT